MKTYAFPPRAQFDLAMRALTSVGAASEGAASAVRDYRITYEMTDREFRVLNRWPRSPWKANKHYGFGQ